LPEGRHGPTIDRTDSEGAMWWQEHVSEFVTLFLVVDPIGVLPSFLALAGQLDQSTQRKIAVRAVVAAFAVLVFFILAGNFVLRHMDIPIRAFQIAGGIVLFLVALEMVRGEEHAASATGGDKLALAIYPLAIPKIAGPGAMLAVVLLTDDDRFNFAGQLVTIGIVVVVMAIQLAILLAAGPILRVVGSAVAGVIGRVMGLLLAALAVSMVMTAVGDWIGLPKL
jgi:multiple antibiotic resistance protein